MIVMSVLSVLLKALFPSREKGHDDDQYYFYKLYKKYTSYYILTVTCQQHHQLKALLQGRGGEDRLRVM